jgi:2-oxoglutarate ferredoxin oxidoreductase subunit gamma
VESVLKEKDFETLSIRFSGFGGQGIVLAGVIYGEAAVADGLNAVQTQSYGSASRGGASKCDLIISKEKIYELESSQIDVLISMSQDAYETYIKQLKRGGVLIIDKDLVRANTEKVQVHEISATDIAFKEFGQKIMGNMVIVGYLAALLGIVSNESLRKSIRRHLPEKLVEDNFRALEEGHNLGLERSKRREN